MGIKEALSPSGIKSRITQYRRTIEISRKPDKEEWLDSAKITGAGIVVIGAVGFTIFVAYHLIVGALGGGI